MKFFVTPLLKLVLPGLLIANLMSGCSFADSLVENPINPTGSSRAEETVSPAEIIGTPLATKISEVTHRVETAAPPKVTSLALNPSQTSIAEIETIPCNLASAGIPLDVTIPDDSRLEPGQKFSKVWRLVNNGSCIWTADYAVVYFSGDALGANLVQPIISAVPPGETVEFAVDMVAPDEPGLYASFWMLQSNSGELFGIGPNGNSPFWVRIQVMAGTAAEPSSTSTPVPTTTVLVTGKAGLAIGDSIDLDSGKLNLSGEADGMLDKIMEDQLQWKPMNDARFAIFGVSRPGELECRLASLSDEPLLLTTLEPSFYLCYRTGDGLPGLMRIENMPVGESPLEIEFTTWAVP